MKLIDILNEGRQIKSYDNKLGKIKLDKETNSFGNTLFTYKGKPHRNDGRPAIEYVDGTNEWWLNGKRHREDGPAIEHEDGENVWYLSGKRYTEEKWKEALGK